MEADTLFVVVFAAVIGGLLAITAHRIFRLQQKRSRKAQKNAYPKPMPRQSAPLPSEAQQFAALLKRGD